MPPLAAAIRNPLARRVVVWVLLLALGLHGYSSAVLQMLGPTHRHEDVRDLPSAATSHPFAKALASQVDGLVSAARAFRAEMHARSHAIGVATSAHSHANPHAQPHDHASLGRHHHAADDPSVIVVDGGAGETLADGASTASPPATLPLAMAPGSLPPRAARSPLPWPQAGEARWADALIALPERPPQA